MMVRN